MAKKNILDEERDAIKDIFNSAPLAPVQEVSPVDKKKEAVGEKEIRLTVMVPESMFVRIKNKATSERKSMKELCMEIFEKTID